MTEQDLPTEESEVLARALRAAEEERWDDAAELLRDATAAEPENPEYHCWLGVVERELGMEGIAYERFRRALALGPTDPTVLATLGGALAAFDDPQAESALRSAALLAPELPFTRWAYGAYLSREGMLDAAVVELEAAVELDPTLDSARYELGVARALQGDLPTAIDDFDAAVRLGTGDAWARGVLGLALLEDDRLTEAVPELHAAATARPDDAELQLVAAAAAGAAGHQDAAWEMIERARRSGAPADLAAALEIEEQLDAEEGIGELLRELAASAFRSRLMVRP